MIIFVDLENVKNSGMRGYEYLNDTDTVYLCFSKAVRNLRANILRGLAKNRVNIKLIRLVTARNNALDFYIASAVGELLGKGVQDRIAIITEDKGYYSIADFWRSGQSECGEVCITIADSIADAIRYIGGKEQRVKKVIEDSEMLDIYTYCSGYQEMCEFRDRLQFELGGTGYEDVVDEVFDIYDEDKRPAELYHESLHRFGRERGRVVYAALKQAAGF